MDALPDNHQRMSQAGAYHEDDALAALRESHSPTAFLPLIEANIERLRRILYRMVLCPENTEDLVQETFIKAYARIGQFQGKARFSTWLCSIGVNLAISFLREQRRRGVSVLDQDVADERGRALDRDLESQQEVQRIHRAIAALPAKYRAVVILRVVEELGFDEISGILHCPKATVYWRLHQARKILARRLEVST